MKPTRARNTKAGIDLRCPGCGVDLTEGSGAGFVQGSMTYCCQGCAEGTGCTCDMLIVPVKRSDNRWGDRGWRNKENAMRDRNLGGIDTSGQPMPTWRSGVPNPRLSSVQPEVTNPRRAHRTSETRALTADEASRRRHQVAQSGERARRHKQTGRPLTKRSRSAGYR